MQTEILVSNQITPWDAIFECQTDFMLNSL